MRDTFEERVRFRDWFKSLGIHMHLEPSNISVLLRGYEGIPRFHIEIPQSVEIFHSYIALKHEVPKMIVNLVSLRIVVEPGTSRGHIIPSSQLEDPIVLWHSIETLYRIYNPEVYARSFESVNYGECLQRIKEIDSFEEEAIELFPTDIHCQVDYMEKRFYAREVETIPFEFVD